MLVNLQPVLEDLVIHHYHHYQEDLDHLDLPCYLHHPVHNSVCVQCVCVCVCGGGGGGGMGVHACRYECVNVYASIN